MKNSVPKGSKKRRKRGRKEGRKEMWETGSMTRKWKGRRNERRKIS